MQTCHWQQTLISLMLMGTLTLPCFATRAESSANKGAHKRSGMAGGWSRFEAKLDHTLGLSVEQKEAVRGLLAQQHQELRGLRAGIEPKYQTIQEQTDAKIRALLNPEQQKKFDVMVAQQKEWRSRKKHGS